MAEFTQLPGTLNITVVQADTASIPIRLTGFDLTGYSVFAYPFMVVQLPTDGGVAEKQQLFSGNAGAPYQFTVTVTAAATGDLTVSIGSVPSSVPLGSRWVLFVISPAGSRRSVISGTFTAGAP